MKIKISIWKITLRPMSTYEIQFTANPTPKELFKMFVEPMTEVLEIKKKECIIRLPCVKEGVFFWFRWESIEGSRVTYRRSFGTENGVRMDDSKTNSIVQELNVLTRELVQNYMEKTKKPDTTNVFEKHRWCAMCKKEDDSCKWCACKRIRYCSVECQRKDRPEHKKVCGK